MSANRITRLVKPWGRFLSKYMEVDPKIAEATAYLKKHRKLKYFVGLRDYTEQILGTLYRKKTSMFNYNKEDNLIKLRSGRIEWDITPEEFKQFMEINISNLNAKITKMSMELKE